MFLMGMKFSRGKPEPLLADDFCEFCWSQEVVVFLRQEGEFDVNIIVIYFLGRLGRRCTLSQT